ncbi:alpha/beta hydrolase [Mycolicibacterium novocastrense]|uniref:Alpha/beta hydrolase n=1 Tax=Mycolicibacterium novocastrense TaxID=59813 RepID=A0AAW5SR68_MYCNV|nr:alpha/beta hydrolase [Mycolicibacterium novocastrense]MCV7026238.1 alpha/beta hydrolase [Mycolicibacterium novocastrense]GAT07526.1 alpha/beta hydrolase fold protein [Mycolicibacterium novocastrense]
MKATRTGSGGPPLVFVHGLACDATDWQAQVDWFRTRTTVVVCELPGHGSVQSAPADCTVETYGAAVARAMVEMSLPPAIVVGHSMGCRVALQAYRVRPGAVAGLVLVDGSRIAEGDPAVAERAMSDDLAEDGYGRFMKWFFESMFVPSSDPVLANRIVDRGVGFPAPLGRNLLTSLAGWDAGEVENALDAVRVPLLAIQCTTLDAARERVSLESGQSSAWIDLVLSHVPQATAVVLPGAGHFPQIEQAEEITALIADFFDAI